VKKRDKKKYRDGLLKLKEKALGGPEHLERDNLNRSLRENSGDLSGYSIHLAGDGLPVLAQELEVGLGAEAGEARLKSLRAFMKVAAVQTAPVDGLLPLEDAARLDVGRQSR
jgi:hypothetical protein